MSRLKVDTITNLSGGAVDLPGFEGGGGGGTVTPQKVAILADAKPSGTSGGASVAGWQDRTLNTIVSDDYNLVTLTNNTEFTLTAGTYLIEWSTPGYRANGFTSKLTNVTAGSTQQMGSIEYSDSFDYFATVDSTGAARVVITENTTYKIELNVQTANAFGLGDGRYNTGDDNIFTQVTITDLSVVGGGGGGGGGGTTKANIYGTAKAWGEVGEFGALLAGRNVTSSYAGGGVYAIAINPPMASDNYAVTFGSVTGATAYVSSKTASAISVILRATNTQAALSGEFSFACYDEEPAEIVVGSGTVANTNIYGTAKAWGSFNATGATISATNLSATSPSAGIYSVSFDTAMADNKYTVVATSSYNPNNVVTDCITANKTTTGFTVYVNQSISGASQFNNFDIAVYDDQPAEIALTTFGDVINYSGAAAWGDVAVDGTLKNGLNTSSVVNDSVGSYLVSFSTPLPSDSYSVTLTSEQYDDLVFNKTATGFAVRIRNINDVLTNAAFSFQVFATNALPPKGGTGTDSWATVDRTTVNGACNVPASFNVESVTRASEGFYSVLFSTPMPNSNYSVNLTGEAASGFVANATYGNCSTTGFTVTIYDTFTTDTFTDAGFSIQVNATNATLPQTVTTEQIDAAINNPGLSAWASVAADASIENGLNVSSVTYDGSGYTVVFVSPMPDSNYSVTGTSNIVSSNTFFEVQNKTATGFTYYNIDVATGIPTLTLEAASFQVAATNALPPKGGTGADAWVQIATDGSENGSFNVTSSFVSQGLYQVTFNTPMPSGNYAIATSSSAYSVLTQNKTSSGFQVLTLDATNNPQNYGAGCIVHATNATLPTTFTEAQIQSVIDAQPQGIAKAWVYYSSFTNTILSSFNIASVDDLASNYVRVNFTTPFPSLYYIAVAGAIPLASGNDPLVLQELNTAGSPRTTSSAIFYANQNANRFDSVFQLAFYSVD